MQQRSLGWVFLLFLAFGAGGCSTVSTFERSQTTIEADAYVAAFSFDTRALGDWPFESAMVDLRNGPPIAMASNESGLTMLMFQMPGSTLKLGDLLFSQTVSEGARVYESKEAGPKVKLERGSVTYIGSLVIDDILMDDETGIPIALRLRIVDRWNSNELAWESVFPIFAGHDPARQIAAGWGDSQQVELRPIQVSRSWEFRSQRYSQGSRNTSTHNKRNKTTPRPPNPSPPKE